MFNNCNGWNIRDSYDEAKKFYDMLNCEKEYLLFDEDSGSQMHGQMGGYATAAELLFDLIEKHL